MRDPESWKLSGESTFIYVQVPHGARHRRVRVKVTKGYEHNCGYGFWVNGKYYHDLKIFGIKKAPNLRNTASLTQEPQT